MSELSGLAGSVTAPDDVRWPTKMAKLSALPNSWIANRLYLSLSVVYLLGPGWFDVTDGDKSIGLVVWKETFTLVFR